MKKKNRYAIAYIHTALLVGSAVFLVAPLPAAAAVRHRAPLSRPLEVSGWIPYWRTATGTADALKHLDAFTEINPFGYTVKTDGTLYDALHVGQEPWLSLFAAAKAKRVRVVPTVMWSDTQAIHAVLSNRASRIALEKNIVATVRTNNFDGIDIDFEGKRAEDKNHFSLFLKGLSLRMGNKWIMCSIEPRTPVADRYEGTPPPDARVYANDYRAVNKYCDRVRLMTYDQGTIDVKLSGTQTGLYIPVADPKWVARVVTLAAQTISKKKLEMGVATYGYEYRVTPLSISGYRYDLRWAFDPKYALDLATQRQLVPRRNTAGELSFSYVEFPMGATSSEFATSSLPRAIATTSIAGAAAALAATTTTAAPLFNIVWWSDAQAIADKVALAKKLGIRGVALFKIDGGEDPGLWSVLPKR